MPSSTKLRLGVNIDHIATLRQVRGTTYPNLIEAANTCVAAGADGITIHLREDRRHIQDRDVYSIRRCVKTILNLEMANHPDIVAIALKVRPDEVCMVPERRRELTTEGGLDAAGQERQLRPTIQKLMKAGIAVSLFIAANPRQIQAAARLGVPYIELHTGTFCDSKGAAARRELKALRAAACLAHSLGLNVNAGHGINLDNITPLMTIPYLDTLNIGHSIVARSVFTGLKQAVMEMRKAMRAYAGGKA